MSKLAVPEWLFLIVLSAVAGLAELGFVIVNISSLPMLLEQGLGLASLPGIAMAIFYTAEAAGNSPMGALADRVGRRRMMLLGALLSVVTSLSTAFIPLKDVGNGVAIPLLLVMRALDGIGASMLWPSVFASIGDRCAPERQARAMTVLNTTYLAGIAIGPYCAGLVNDQFGAKFTLAQPEHYNPSFYLAGGCFLLAAVFGYLVAPGKAETHQRPAGHEAGSAFSVDALKRTWKRIPMVMLLGFVIFLAVGLIGPYVKTYFISRFHLSESTFGKVLLVPAMLIGAVSIPIGHLTDRWGKTKSIQLGMLLCTSSLWLIFYVQSQLLVVALGSLLGVGFVMAFPAYMAYLSDLADDHERGGLIGSVRLVQGIGAFLGAGGASLLHGLSGGSQVVFYLSCTFLAIGTIKSRLKFREVNRA
ncbi:MAG: MFS transporter [Armatimonadaceae bacterium]